MISNLFSVFDPCTGILSINWIRTAIFMVILSYKIWILNNKISFVFKIVIDSLQKEMSILITYKGTTIIIIRLFIFVIYNNLIGLIPYVFTSSAHLVFSLAMAIPIWLGFILYGWINKTNIIFTHLVPSGTPVILIPFIVIIETIRNVIRPGSLAVRLTANIIAGHLLISLLGSNISIIILTSTIIIFIILIIFELAVALIQAYVFITLTTLYSREI